MRIRRAVAGVLQVPVLGMLLLGTLVQGCSGDEGPREVAYPDGLTTYVDQIRDLRATRDVFVQLVNETGHEITVSRAEIISDAFEDVTWTGEKSFSRDAALDFEMPRTRCPDGLDVDVRLTYRIDGGEELVSTTTATDRYGAIGTLVARDCARHTLEEAADVELGEHRVEGRGRRSVFRLPVTLTPTGDRAGVAFRGFGDTVLFEVAAPAPRVGTARPVPLGADDPAVTVTLGLVPARCDPHALAEDKVGTLVPVHVRAPGLDREASYDLPIDERTRGDLKAFWAAHCGV